MRFGRVPRAGPLFLLPHGEQKVKLFGLDSDVTRRANRAWVLAVICALGLPGCAPGPHPPVLAFAPPRLTERGTEIGLASWYGPGFEGRPTASGEPYDPQAMTAAHRTLPLGTRVRVVDLATGRSVAVRINDRGPFVPGRIIDLSRAAAARLGILDRGIARVEIFVEQPGSRWPATRYAVQVGAYRDRHQAYRRARAVARLGQPVYVQRLAGSRPLYRVRVGLYRERREAERTAARLRARGYRGVVVEEPPPATAPAGGRTRASSPGTEPRRGSPRGR
ncbi:MAG: septal ring lytic transglycosylase RlpA family protein [Candidatus Dadabacteria bacterium]|nr:MAG: septal ring lytic transglycosylase RlpA family protein [Candidatus Dadabacteria bacterium]